jgi:MYXO-CTERM domain-containing protein
LDDIGDNLNQGSAYIFRNLDTATGTITQNAKLIASDGAPSDGFGASVSLDGDLFVIGAPSRIVSTGAAYSGSIASVTTLDTGNTSRTISGVSFISQDDWIIGETTDLNSVTLSSGDTANVTAVGKAVYIGKNAGSDNNTLTINGTLTANSINVGATGTTGNKLVVNGSIGSTAVTLNAGGTLSGSGSVGSLTVGNGGTISPGNSPGTQNVVGNLTWLAGGNYNWQTLNTVGTPGTQWDLIAATGQLDLSALTIGSEFNINLWSLSSTGPDVNGNIANFNNTLPYQWLIASAAGGITGFTGSNQFLINTGAINGTAGFSNPLGGGTFNISQTGNSLYLNFDPSSGAVPEPGTWAVGALLVGGAALVRWRRRNQRG